MRVRKGLIAAAVATLAAAMAQAPASALGPPMNFVQTTADPPVVVPPTAHCTKQVIQHDFANSYYQPAIGTLSPPAACPAPWSKVVLSFSASVGGVQFDRIADVYVGDVNVFSTSTSEPCCTPGATVSTTWKKDVSEYIPLFRAAQPVTVFLNNVNDSTYTGVYHVVVAFTYYRTGPGAPPASHPNRVTAVDDMSDSGGDGYFFLTASGQRGSTAVTFPRNLLRLKAELYAQGHGPCEEFWWADPSQCGVSTPYREVDVYVDGQLAGAAPVYPVVFTGADGPGLWEPIPSPRAWQLRPYTLDLTPFVGELTNGAPHTIALDVSDVVYESGDFWLVGANLLEWTDPASTQTTGGITSISAPPSPTESSTEDPTGLGVVDVFTATHALAFAGTVHGSGGTQDVSVNEHISEHATELGLSIDSTWDWVNNASDGAASSDSDSTYSIVNSSPGSFQFSDANQTTTSTGAQASSSSFTETMATAAVGVAANGAECEAFKAQHYEGHASYAKTLAAAGGVVVSSRPSYTPCAASQQPSTSVPDAPWSPLLVLTASPAALLVRRFPPFRSART